MTIINHLPPIAARTDKRHWFVERYSQRIFSILGKNIILQDISFTRINKNFNFISGNRMIQVVDLTFLVEFKKKWPTMSGNWRKANPNTQPCNHATETRKVESRIFSRIIIIIISSSSIIIIIVIVIIIITYVHVCVIFFAVWPSHCPSLGRKWYSAWFLGNC